MTVNVSTHPKATDDLDRAIRALRENYRRAQEQNAHCPGFIRTPIAWALYKTWRMFDKK